MPSVFFYGKGTAMAEVHGKSGSLTFTNLTAGVKEFTWKGDSEAVEVTDFADAGIKSFIVGKRGWTASAKTNWDAANTARDGDSASLTLTTTSGKTYAGTAILTSVSVGASVDGVETADYEFQGTGACTVTLS